jgi:hypothetical protein
MNPQCPAGTHCYSNSANKRPLTFAPLLTEIETAAIHVPLKLIPVSGHWEPLAVRT